MYIPFIYILFIAEAMLVFFILSIILGIVAYRLANRKTSSSLQADETRTVNPGSSYIELLDIEIMKNTAQSKIDKQIEHDVTEKPAPDTTTEEKHSRLLKARDLFLHVERTAAEKAGNDIQFWQHIYAGISKVLDHFKTIEHEITANTDNAQHTTEVKEKVFYIETQGKKVDGEVNRLKDIIYEQENTLSDLLKTLKNAEEEHQGTEQGELISALHAQASHFERQLRDSKTCMDVLEMENNRLQEELHKLDAKNTGSDKSKTDDNSKIDTQNMREMLKKQEQQITLLTNTIDELKLSTEQTEKIKSTLNEFAHSSQEMMGCITILEEENARLQATSHDAQSASGDEPLLKTQIKKLAEEAIKKDVAYAKLQDEFASMEKEYLAMYNAIHGNNS